MSVMWTGGEVMVAPILVTRWKCGKCDREYSNLQMAADCENSHYALDDFIILDMSKEQTPYSCFPRSIHVVNQKTNTIASYLFNHNKVKPSKNHRGYRFDSGLFPSEEEDG